MEEFLEAGDIEDLVRCWLGCVDDELSSHDQHGVFLRRRIGEWTRYLLCDLARFLSFTCTTLFDGAGALGFLYDLSLLVLNTTLQNSKYRCQQSDR